MTELRHGSFESLIARPDSHAVVDLAGEARSLLVLFGGIAGGVSIPVFEFFRLTSTMPGKKVFLRDPRRSWYQLGIPGIGDTAESIELFLREVIERAAVDRVVMAGASAGGFAAIAFGARCGANDVLAFSPQTFIDAANRRCHGDLRWAEQIDALHASAGSQLPGFDLLQMLSNNPGATRFQIHVSNDDPLDLVHARRLVVIEGVDVIEHDRGGHRLVKTLRDRGLLRPLLLDALIGP